MSDINKDHPSKSVQEILREEYGDYDKNWWHYNREYKMLDELNNRTYNYLSEQLKQKDKEIEELKEITDNCCVPSQKEVLRLEKKNSELKERIKELEKGYVNIYNGIMTDINWTETSPLNIIDKLLNK